MDLDYKFSQDAHKKCRLCQYYNEHNCTLLTRETRGSFVCSGWMPIYKSPLDLWKGAAILKQS